MIGAGKGDVAEAPDAIGLALHVADLPVERQRRLVALARAVVIGATKGDLAEAHDAIGLAEHGADLPVERQRLLVALARGFVIGAVKGDVAEAPDAIGLALQVADVTKSLRDPRQGSVRRETGKAVQLAKPVYSRP